MGRCIYVHGRIIHCHSATNSKYLQYAPVAPTPHPEIVPPVSTRGVITAVLVRQIIDYHSTL